MKGICFTEPLFHKVIEGAKTQTRRMITIQPPDNRSWRIGTLMDSTAKEDKKKIGKNYYLLFENEYTIKESLIKNCFSPKYKVGEKVYLKEPYILYQEEYQESKTSQSGIQYAYKFGNHLSIEEITGKSDSKWKNKLFMPESAARYFIEITAVRVERLQDISDEDCMKEGIQLNPEAIPIGYPFGSKFSYNNGYYNYTTPQEAFAALIDKISGKGTWEKNPWVWVYDFELINK